MEELEAGACIGVEGWKCQLGGGVRLGGAPGRDCRERCEDACAPFVIASVYQSNGGIRRLACASDVQIGVKGFAGKTTVGMQFHP